VGRRFEVPGSATLELEHVVLDLNGTLTDRGELIKGVSERLHKVAAQFELHLLSADTFGTMAEISRELGLDAVRISTGTEKQCFVETLGAERCAAIGNGNNDELMLKSSALGIAVIGREGTSPRALAAADLACASILDALDLLLDERALAATLRS
jgi:soluble P-type ATPase